VRLLYVEDDPVALSYVGRGLRHRGFEVETSDDGASGLELALARAYDLLILDVMLPGLDGLSLMRGVREAGLDTPVLFLSARGAVSDRIRGLDLGADDYLPKPFAFAELVSRIQAVARRRRGEPDDGRFETADLVLDSRRRRVERAGRRIELTPKQFEILELLLRHAGCAVSRSLILERVWGLGFETRSNPIDVHVNGLRARIDADFEPKLIHSVRGVGYVLEDRSRLV
jgi:two-component system copper resistance phosphate regulon response regulator CusR